MFLTIELGEYRCSSKSPSTTAGEDDEGDNDETICALIDREKRQSKAPVKITVDFGDGSGEQLWTREDPKNLWVHQYQLPGRYWVHVSSIRLNIMCIVTNYFVAENEYDQAGDEEWLEVEVVDPLFDMMGIEVWIIKLMCL